MTLYKTLGDVTAAVAGYKAAPVMLAAAATQSGPVTDALAEGIKGISALLIAVASRWIYERLFSKGSAPVTSIATPVPALPMQPAPPIFINDKSVNDGSKKEDSPQKGFETGKTQSDKAPVN